MATNEEIKLINPAALHMPKFPGQQNGQLTVEQIQSYIKRQKRLKGFPFTVPTGGTTQFDIKLSGTAKILLGLAIFGQPTAGTSWTNFTEIQSVQFVVNNEIIIDQVSPNFLTQQFQNSEYYYIPRPLSGQDSISFFFTNTGAAIESANVVIYYI